MMNTLLQDLCVRVPYGVYCKSKFRDEPLKLVGMTLMCGKQFAKLELDEKSYSYEALESFEPKPYLRPMSSMTEEEQNFIRDKFDYCYDKRNKDLCSVYYHNVLQDNVVGLVDYLVSRHFDIRGLLGRGQALEAPEEMYKFD